VNTAMNCPVAENADLRLAGQQLTSHEGLSTQSHVSVSLTVLLYYYEGWANMNYNL
jgi:hypothetical protein